MENHKTAGNDPVNVMPTEIHTGLTKREYFAGLAMQGLLSSHALDENSYHELAVKAVNQIDALIEELNK